MQLKYFDRDINTGHCIILPAKTFFSCICNLLLHDKYIYWRLQYRGGKFVQIIPWQRFVVKSKDSLLSRNSRNE